MEAWTHIHPYPSSIRTKQNFILKLYFCKANQEVLEGKSVKVILAYLGTSAST